MTPPFWKPSICLKSSDDGPPDGRHPDMTRPSRARTPFSPASRTRTDRERRAGARSLGRLETVCIDDPLDFGPAGTATRACLEGPPYRFDGDAPCLGGGGDLIGADPKTRADGGSPLGQTPSRAAGDNGDACALTDKIRAQLLDGPVARHDDRLRGKEQRSCEATIGEICKAPLACRRVVVGDKVRSRRAAEQSRCKSRPVTTPRRESKFDAPASWALRQRPIVGFEQKRPLTDDCEAV